MRSKIQSNDILISLIGTVGRVALLPNLSETMNIHRNLGRIRVKNYEFVYQYLQSTLCANQLKLLSAGNAQSALNLSALKDLKIPSPPNEEQ